MSMHGDYQQNTPFPGFDPPAWKLYERDPFAMGSASYICPPMQKGSYIGDPPSVAEAFALLRSPQAIETFDDFLKRQTRGGIALVGGRYRNRITIEGRGIVPNVEGCTAGPAPIKPQALRAEDV